jgi:hypothetical protein
MVRSRFRAHVSSKWLTESMVADEPATLAPAKLLRDVDQTSLGMEFVLTWVLPSLAFLKLTC